MNARNWHRITGMTVLLSISAPAVPSPNVILVMTDDQGYGDLACNGNPAIQTPHIDQLRSEGVQLDNYHVDPTCAPTRSALLTGRYSDRVGVWHTIQGRNMLRRREVTMADILGQNGYATGIFGKWHLGDCYPYRPEDRGFQHTVYHLAGGVGQAPDYWGNDYFDDTYLKNGVRTRFTGYCTDVWFDEAMAFIRANKGTPFFAYIVPNAPHGPLYCPEAYVRPYEGNPRVSRAEFYGMVTNIDDNMARLMNLLKDEGLAENTILIYTTDNGTAGGLAGRRGFSAGMRGAKGSEYEGGHRVPFIVRWPGGELEAGKSVKRLTAHIDVLPTLIDLCDLSAPDIAFDGTTLRGLLHGDGNEWTNRTLVVESQRVVDPVKWRKCAVMTDRWRLVNGAELFDLQADPGQKADIADQHPEIVQRLRASYESFWNEVSAEHDLTSYIVVGSDDSPVVTLSSHDWLVEQVPWNQSHVMKGAMAKPGHWAIDVERAGTYEISLRRWPAEADIPINAGTYGKAFAFERARLRIGDVDETREIPAGAGEVTFRVQLDKGITQLAPLFIGGGVEATPYYAYVTHDIRPGWQTPGGMAMPVFDPTLGRIPPQMRKRIGEGVER